MAFNGEIISKGVEASRSLWKQLSSKKMTKIGTTEHDLVEAMPSLAGCPVRYSREIEWLVYPPSRAILPQRLLRWRAEPRPANPGTQNLSDDFSCSFLVAGSGKCSVGRESLVVVH